MSSVAEPRGRSIAWPIFALVIAAVVVATAVPFAATFRGPPRDRAVSLRQVAIVLRAGPTLATGTASTLRIGAASSPRPPRRGEHPDPDIARQLAMLLNAAPGDVRAYTDRPPFVRDDALLGTFTLAWQVNGTWRTVASPPRPLFTHWHAVTLLATLAAILALAGPAWLLARAISRPLRRLAAAAEAVRAGTSLPPLPSGGAREVRELTRAVTGMHDRLQRHAEARNAMLGGIAHDLGTPLSRLAFWIDALPEPARARAEADLDEMRGMIAATLAFARDEAKGAAATRLDLGSLLDSLTEDYAATGADVTLEPGPRAVVRGDAGALRRMAANLTDNALRYGTRARIGWVLEDGAAVVRIDDDGPGVDPAEAERLFEPFVRGERSRNRATGGAGLGLAIVRSIAARHDGTVTLGNRPDGGGARATVTLPLA